MKEQIPIFVLSSGRTGSTLLAKMINRHPELLCVSDLFEPVGDEPYFNSTKTVDGKEFFKILSRPSYKQRIKYWRKRATTELLFLPEDDNIVSLLLSYTLPFLTGGNPMNLFYELKEAVQKFGKDTIPNHTIRFFNWLRDKYRKKLWVERTGGSLPHTRKIVNTWPNAKIVHNYRDTRETAISMMTGSFFRLYLELTKNPNLDEWDSDYMPPVEEMAKMLNKWIVDAVEVLGTLPDHQKMDLKYEDLMADTVGTLLRFVNFIFERSEPTIEDIKWAEQESVIIKSPPLRFPKLNHNEQQRLQYTCYESLKVLEYI